MQILDAAIRVLGAEGPRHLTHRSVDRAAGLPPGSTSNYFRTRGALLEAIVTRLEALDRQDWETMAGLPPAANVDDLVTALASYVRHAIGPGRARTLARYGLFLEAASARPELRKPLARSRAALLVWGAQWMRVLGSPDPEAHCGRMLDYLEGVIFHQMTFPERGFDPGSGICGILTGGRLRPRRSKARVRRPAATRRKRP